MAILTVNKAGKKINGQYVVQSVSFEQQPLEKIAIAGETGSGKTTLMKMIGGHEQLEEGQIKFLDRDILGPLDKLIPGHPGIAYLSQHFELRNNYHVWEVLDYGNKLTVQQAKNIYQVCKIDHLLHRKTNELSGGERQRIALAKQLVTLPKLLLLDEPFSNLDSAHRAIVKQVIEEIDSNLQTSCILIAHDPVDILSWADTVLVMQQGRLIQQGSPEYVYKNPVNEYCAALFGGYNLLNDKLASLFAEKFGVRAIPFNNILRPERIGLTNEAAYGLKVIVMRNIFCGAYYLTEVLLANELIKLYTYKSSYAPGDQFYAYLKED